MNAQIKMTLFFICLIMALHAPLALADTVYVVATAYTADCRGCSGVTASGIRANAWGPIPLMAVDPKVFRLGRCYRLKFADGHYNTYLAADTGGRIQGNHIDLLLKSRESAVRFGRQMVELNGPVACPNTRS